MIRESEFGLKQIFDQRFDRNNYKTKSKSFYQLLDQLERFSTYKGDGDGFCVDSIRSEFEKQDTIFEKLQSVMAPKDVSLFINLNYDFLELCALILPKRHDTFHLRGYPDHPATKKANQLEFRILQRIAEQFRFIAEMKKMDELARIRDIGEIFQLPEKKGLWSKCKNFLR